ncbi:hypothetical protein D9758_017431 [Tetrapyrgos nigripes]|uniref:Chitin deacetylase n=1 Tax=Tetrapyrgos nigripes TaxID=182062 RepID=A0A8H5C378_9AGAR|nr:hypothetical protein D9758_017431 [Tetrapyrgos nigripes]
MFSVSSLITLSLAAIAFAHAVEPGAKRQTLAQVIPARKEANTIALTFDDGPYIYGPDLVDLLDQNDIKGTFFYNGDNYRCIYDKDMQSNVQYAYSHGHQVSSHTWHHDDLATLTWDQIHDEMWHVKPYGSYNDLVLRASAVRGQKVVIWDFDDGDSTGSPPDESKADYDQLVSEHPNTVIALNHETYVSNVKIISITTGTKCLPMSRYPLHGEALHDSHAEILAQRGAVRWVLDEIIRETEGGYPKSEWISRQPEGGKYALKDGGKLCFDTSTRYLAAFQDPEMAALKNSQHTAAPTSTSSSSISTHSRGRNNYSLYSALRTKPGRADSPPTLCMSCSDKLAMWNVLGIQGALGAEVMKPLYFDEVVVGEVAGDEMRKMVKEDCERAFWGRLDVDWDGARGGFVKEVESLSRHYHLHKPAIYFTDIPFILLVPSYKYHPGYYSKVGMRHFHLTHNWYWRPIINVDKLVPGEENKGLSEEFEVIAVSLIPIHCKRAIRFRDHRVKIKAQIIFFYHYLYLVFLAYVLSRP